MRLEVWSVGGIGEVRPGDDVAEHIADAIAATDDGLIAGDIVVVTHKIVSKAEGRLEPAATDDDYRRIVEHEAAEIIRRRGPLVITQTHHGLICANAGVDRSNVEGNNVVLLPKQPDRSAHLIRMHLQQVFGCEIGVLVTDTFGRPWRRGLTDVAIGCSGVLSVVDLKGTHDMQGRVLEVSEVAVIDEIAAAADLVMGKASGNPVAIVRGLSLAGDGRASDLVRPATEDMFR
ncbi:MAG TPA: coenzyme F420-0:L-glutamate ligase [Actinobacteria bacterium]|nr:coenzyme F420-0:L-glutamate ligase [Actinomycetota bacterium]